MIMGIEKSFKPLFRRDVFLGYKLQSSAFILFNSIYTCLYGRILGVSKRFKYS